MNRIRCKTVLVDYDGTIVNSERMYMKVFAEFCKQHGYDYNDDDHYDIQNSYKSKYEERIDELIGKPAGFTRNWNEAEGKAMFNEFMKKGPFILDWFDELDTYVDLSNDPRIEMMTANVLPTVFEQLNDYPDITARFDRFTSSSEYRVRDKVECIKDTYGHLPTGDVVLFDNNCRIVRGCLDANIPCVLVRSSDMEITSDISDILNHDLCAGYIVSPCTRR